MRIDALLQRELESLRSAGLFRESLVVEGPQGPLVFVEGRAALCLCSNNYLGLANDPSICEAAVRALRDVGLGACGSRMVTGTMALHRQVEERIAAFVGQPRALFFSTGYGANLGVIQALAIPRGLILSDERNHASLIDGCRMGRAEVKVYRHADVEHVSELLLASRGRYDLTAVVTESLFSMDGDLAPLGALRELCDEHDAALVVDDAHALGVMGPDGRGACAWLGVTPDVVTGTFGKAMGCSGAFVAGPSSVVSWIENRARSHIFSTAPSPVIAAAVMAALDVVIRADDRRAQLRRHTSTLRSGLARCGYQVTPGETQIIPLLLGSPERAMRLSKLLLDQGAYVHGIRPPSVAPGTSRLRITPMATHTEAQIEDALAVFDGLRGEA